MGLNIKLNYEGRRASLRYSYSVIHVLREYACRMVDAKEENDPVARQNFPNLIWHDDAEGYYVGFLPEIWNEQDQLWVGSVEGLYKELQRVSTHMLQAKYEGLARDILTDLLELFTKVGYNPLENSHDAFIIFS